MLGAGLKGFKGVKCVGGKGGPVVVTSELSARFRASQKPLQMHPAWEPPVPQTERENKRKEGLTRLSSLSQSGCALTPKLHITQFCYCFSRFSPYVVLEKNNPRPHYSSLQQISTETKSDYRSCRILARICSG